MTELLIALAVIVAALAALEFLLPASAARLALAIERARAGLKLGQANTASFDFAYLHGGSGENLVLVHGFGADKDNFTRVARHLTRRFRVFAVDLPGFGASTRLADASYRIPDQAAYLHAIVDSLGLEHFHLGGSSMGGAIAIDYAAAHPERVRSLWLLAPGGVLSATDSEVVAEYRQHGRSLLVVEEPHDYPRILNLAMEQQPFLPLSLKRTLGKRAADDATLHKRIFDEIATSPPSEDRGHAVIVPALIVWGRKDRVLDVSGATILHKAMPNSTLLLMDDIGHLPMIETPKQAARDFIAFVDKM